MIVLELAITGGPCGGKTTCIKVLRKSLASMGYRVIFVPETATEIAESGINLGEAPVEPLQRLIISRSINKEQTIRDFVNAVYKDDDVIILYDRGIIDAKAYMPEPLFKQILAEEGLMEEDVKNRYTAVFHMVTAANGAEEFYTLANNDARHETPEEAVALDLKTQSVWMGHPNFYVIDNSTAFPQKLSRLLEKVLHILNNTKH